MAKPNKVMRNKSIKVISISTFNPDKPAYHPSPDQDQYYVQSWSGLWARRTKERYPDLDIEVWRPEPDFNKVSSRKSFGIVDCTIFPAKNFVISRTVTLEMLRRLLKYTKKYRLVLHNNTIFDWKFNLMMPVLLPGVKIIISHHGGVLPHGKSLKVRIKKKLLDWSFRKIHTATYLRNAVKNELEHASKHIHLVFLPVGANFDHFKPLDKAECRKKLNLPSNKVLGVYVGKFYRLKGVDYILEAYRCFKDKNFNVLFAGGSKNDELYPEVAESGCPFWGHVDHDLLREIYSAADFYIHPAFHPDFGGFDVVLMEALACNIPILSPQLKELDFDHSELGMLLQNENELLPKCEMMLENFAQFSRCRDAAIEHLEGNTAIIDKLYRIYTGI